MPLQAVAAWYVIRWHFLAPSTYDPPTVCQDLPEAVGSANEPTGSQP